MSQASSGEFGSLYNPQSPPRYWGFLIRPDGHVERAEKLAASDDSAALSQAKALVDGHDVELWDGVRFIERFETDEPTI